MRTRFFALFAMATLLLPIQAQAETFAHAPGHITADVPVYNSPAALARYIASDAELSNDQTDTFYRGQSVAILERLSPREWAPMVNGVTLRYALANHQRPQERRASYSSDLVHVRAPNGSEGWVQGDYVRFGHIRF